MNGHNPDILTCLANLSADEVFTPPKLAVAMLDILPQELFSRPDTTFLDPVCKSGVFLREIARRLNDGLKDQMPDEQARINHILTKQVFGLAITELTSLLSRRSVYCSKKSDGKYSICTAFTKADGNIKLPKAKHNWNKAGKCESCGANQGEYERDETFEAYAYPFIHGIDPTEIFKVKFDVIIGNPPYQLSDGGHGRSASPLYHKFVRQAKKLEPRYLMMVIPSRWFGGGKGLDDFREEMLTDDRIRQIVDFENVADVFPGIDLAGGVCYFLWDRDSKGLCDVTNVNGNSVTSSKRRLDEFKTLIRHGAAVSVVRKVVKKDEARMNNQVSARKPFGLPTTERPKASGDLILRWQKGEGPYPRDEIRTGIEMINRWKVITSYVGHDHAGNPGSDGRRRVLSKIDIIPPKTICNETYLVIGHYASKTEAENLVAYMKTRFFRFLVSQFMYSHHITKAAYVLVPKLDMKQRWTDVKLNAKYNLASEEVKFIESKIRSFDRNK